MGKGPPSRWPHALQVSHREADPDSVGSRLLREVLSRFGWSRTMLAKVIVRNRSTTKYMVSGKLRVPASVERHVLELLSAERTGEIPPWLDPCRSKGARVKRPYSKRRARL